MEFGPRVPVAQGSWDLKTSQTHLLQAAPHPVWQFYRNMDAS